MTTVRAQATLHKIRRDGCGDSIPVGPAAGHLAQGLELANPIPVAAFEDLYRRASGQILPATADRD